MGKLKHGILIWQQPDWPNLTASAPAVTTALLCARQAQGEVMGKAKAIGLEQFGDAAREMLVQEVMATSAIEGEKLSMASVRFSVLRKLGLPELQVVSRSRSVDGLVDVIQDAMTGFNQPLDEERLCLWQASLFPSGISGLRRIATGRYRDHADRMQIVSGSPGNETVHYTAPPSAQVDQEMKAFLRWFGDTAPGGLRADQIDGIARAAMAHLWFETIHPFEDGNGRIGRTISDLALAQDRGSATRLYSLSDQLLKSRNGYYDALNAAQQGTTDISTWIEWFAHAFILACQASGELMDVAIGKARFWTSHGKVQLNERQRKVIHRLLEDGDGGFLGGLNADKYMKLTSTSKATATRDLRELLRADMLLVRGQGKATRYYVAVPGWTHGLDPDNSVSRALMR